MSTDERSDAHVTAQSNVERFAVAIWDTMVQSLPPELGKEVPVEMREVLVRWMDTPSISMMIEAVLTGPGAPDVQLWLEDLKTNFKAVLESGEMDPDFFRGLVASLQETRPWETAVPPVAVSEDRVGNPLVGPFAPMFEALGLEWGVGGGPIQMPLDANDEYEGCGDPDCPNCGGPEEPMYYLSEVGSVLQALAPEKMTEILEALGELDMIREAADVTVN